MFRLKKFPIITVASVVVISLLVAALSFRPPQISQSRNIFVNILKLPLKSVTFIAKAMENILNFPFIFKENRNLKKTVGILYSRLVHFEELQQENARLKQLLKLKSKSKYTLLAARVIGRDASNWASSVVIDRGLESGVKVDSAVLTEFGLAGKVMETGPGTSRVMLINDFNMHIPGLIQGTREMGLVVGTLTGGCRMIYLSAESPAKADDLIITSGLSETFPKGIVIGKITGVYDDFGGLGKVASVKPAVTLASLEEVMVVVK